jgi:hypothetical protein
MDSKFEKRFYDLEKIKDFDDIKEQKRGLEFEKLILDIFEYHKILIRRSYHTKDNKSEQIDGAVEFANQIALIEVKWKESNIAASELYSFCGKVDNKFFGTIGIFISKEILSDNFITSLNKGRRQNIIVLHGDDVHNIIKKDFPLKDYLIEARKLLSTDNINYISSKKFMEQYKSEDEKIEYNKKIRSRCKIILNQIISKKSQNIDSLLIDIESDCNEDEKYFILDYLLKEVKNLDLSIVYMPTIERCHRIFKIINKLLENDNLVEKSWPIFFDELKRNPNNYIKDDFFEKYQEIIDNLGKSEIKRFNNILVNAWELFFGDWNTENTLARVTDKIWDKLESEQKNILFKLFFEIICSDRKDKFPQKQFAMKMIEQAEEENSDNLEKDVFNWIKGKIEKENEKYKEADLVGSIDIESNSLFFAESYNEIRYILKMKKDSWQEAIISIYREVYGK